MFVCVLRLHPTNPGPLARFVCVCLRSGFGCTAPLLAGVLGCGCVCVPARLVPRHPWLGCAVWVCVLGLGSRLRPATPGWDVGVCLCLCARSGCTPPILAGVRCCGCVCLGSGFRCASLLLARVMLGVCVVFCALRLSPAPSSSDVRCWCVCFDSSLGCATPLVAGVLGCVRVCVRAPLVPCHSWMDCAVWVSVLGLAPPLRPATPGWCVGMCVCLCARSARTPPIQAGVRRVGVCVWARVSAAPRHSWLGYWGKCVFVCALQSLPIQ